jgi:hypothetical protein
VDKLFVVVFDQPCFYWEKRRRGCFFGKHLFSPEQIFESVTGPVFCSRSRAAKRSHCCCQEKKSDRCIIATSETFWARSSADKKPPFNFPLQSHKNRVPRYRSNTKRSLAGSITISFHRLYHSDPVYSSYHTTYIISISIKRRNLGWFDSHLCLVNSTQPPLLWVEHRVNDYIINIYIYISITQKETNSHHYGS